MTVEQKAEEYTNKNDTIVTGFEENLDCTDQMQQAFIDGYHECEKEHEWHYDGTPDTTHKTCLVNVDYLPNIMLCFWNGEVWIESRTLDRFKKVKAWKYVDFPQELKNGKERT